jgi:hypothetical protein
VKQLLYIVLTAVLILGMVYVYLHRQVLGLSWLPGFGMDESTSSDQSDANSAPARMIWQKVDRTPDGVKVELPSDTKDIQVPAYNERGGSEPVSMILANPDAETSFSVAWADNPPVARANAHAADKTLDMARDDALARTQSRLINESHASFGGYPARDFEGRNVEGGVINSRLIYAGQRLYMLIAAFPSAGARRDRDVSRFFNSFAVTSSAGTQ